MGKNGKNQEEVVQEKAPESKNIKKNKKKAAKAKKNEEEKEVVKEEEMALEESPPRAQDVSRRCSFRNADNESLKANSIISSIRLLMEVSRNASTFGQRAFRALDGEVKGYLTKEDILAPIEYQGVATHSSLQELISIVKSRDNTHQFQLQEFEGYTTHYEFYKKVLSFDLVIHDFDLFKRNFICIFNQIKEDRQSKYGGGAPADYIPTLAKAYPNYFASSFCSTHGQFIQIGDFSQEFSIQSIGKVVNYSFVYDKLEEDVHHYVGEEPSGVAFNAPVFDDQGRPHNPMINAGAIMTCAMILKIGKGLEDVLAFYERATGVKNARIDQALYEEERDTGYSNHALTSLMLANNAFPVYETTEKTREMADLALDLYFKACSILVNVESLSKFGAMLANNGVNPSTGERILKPETVQSTVTIMTTCGMYNGAGRFVKQLGIPSKSGVSGGLLSVVPGIGSVATFSPKLNKEGNTVKGIGMMETLGQVYKNFNLFHKDHNKRDILARPFETTINNVIQSIECSAIGDIEGLSRLHVLGVDLSQGDYDHRTPLHLAASNGHFEIVQYLVGKGVNLNTRDRWGSTPLDDAKSEQIQDFLKQKGAHFGNQVNQYNEIHQVLVTPEQYRLLYAASENQVQLIKSLLINLEPNGFDYDMRTALGVAASQGNLETVEYLVKHGADIYHKDARGNDALDDARRENKFNVVQYLQAVIEQRIKSQ